MRLWSVKEGREICSYWFIGEAVWIILVPDGRFDASPRGLQYLAYTEQGTFNSFTAEELKHLFYKPDEVRQEIARYITPARSGVSAERRDSFSMNRHFRNAAFRLLRRRSRGHVSAA